MARTIWATKLGVGGVRAPDPPKSAPRGRKGVVLAGEDVVVLLGISLYDKIR